VNVRAPANLQENIADDLTARRDYSLRCPECKANRKLSAEDFARYLRDGWPDCCGFQMLLESEPKKRA
jgi:hypothetical protein